MATFSDIAKIAQNSDFQSRTAYALTVAAIAAYNEAPSTAGHAQRAAFAIRVLQGSFSTLAVATVVLTNPTIAAEADVATVPGFAIPDADIQFAINSIYNALAGA